MYDFNQEQDQQTRAQGPIPAGSSVLVRLSIRKPNYPADGQGIVGKAKSGMLYLDAEYEVVSGSYQGLKIWEMLFLPAGVQKAQLTDGQRQACAIAGSKVKGMLNAAHCLDPKDGSPQASRKRQISSWLDLNGLSFPVVVGISNQPNEKNGRTYWNNSVGRVITPADKAYRELMDGGEIITDGPTTGEGKQSQKNASSDPFSAPDNSMPDFDEPPMSAYDADMDAPF